MIMMICKPQYINGKFCFCFVLFVHYQAYFSYKIIVICDFNA